MVVNAQHIKGVPGRKTDVKDAEWIADLVRHGLVKASYIPNRDIIWFQITPMVSDLLIGLCAIMMVISVALYIIQNTRILRERLYKQFYIAMTRKIFRRILMR